MACASIFAIFLIFSAAIVFQGAAGAVFRAGFGAEGFPQAPGGEDDDGGSGDVLPEGCGHGLSFLICRARSAGARSAG